MSFLTIDKEGEVVISKEAMAIPSVKELYNSDKRPDGNKPFFNKVLKFVYHQYYNEHNVFQKLSPVERRTRVIEVYFDSNENVITEMEKNPRVRAFIKDYLFYTQLFSERKYIMVLDKIEQLYSHLESIPLKKHQFVEQTVKVKIPGTDQEEMVAVKAKMEVDNTKEYFDSLKMIEVALELEEKIRKKLKQEKTERDINPLSMMDSGEFLNNVPQ